MRKRKPGTDGSFTKEGRLFSFKLDDRLAERIELYLDSPNAVVKFKNQLFTLALRNFLDREEIIARELDKERSRIERMV